MTKRLSDFAKANVSARNIFQLLDRVPEIDNSENNMKGIRIMNDNYNTEIQFDDVHFSYPTRKDVNVLKKFSLTIKKGQNVAIVGSSGCGRYKIMTLLFLITF